MAKINARGAREVARWEGITTGEAGDIRWLFVLRSDGKVLRKLADNATGMVSGYSVYVSFKPTTSVLTEAEITAARIARVERHLASRGYRVNRLAAR